MKSSSLDLAPNMVRSKPPSAASWRRRVQRLQKEAHVFYFVFIHPRTRWYVKLIAAGSAGYLFSPIQLIPSFIPVIGFADDALVLFLGLRLIEKITPADVLAECRKLADAAEARRNNEEARWAAAVAAPLAIVTVWFLIAIVASALMAAYIYH
jgi:uncharacterized membrane protein YkvA (DUF1232 family)